MIAASVFTGTLSPCDASQRLMSYLNPPHVPAPCCRRSLIEIDADGIDDDGPGALQVVDRRHEDLDDLRVRRVALVGLAQDADAAVPSGRPSGAPRGSSGMVAGWPPGLKSRAIAVSATVTGSSGSGPAITCSTATASSSVRVIGPAMSARRLSGDDARAAGQAHRRADAGERLMRGRSANGVAGVAAEADRAEVGGDGRGRAAARAGGDAIERVRILRVARQDRADGLVRRERELGHVRLGEDDRAGRLDALDLERVARRDEALERERTRGALQADGLEVVLDDRRDAVQRPGEAALLGPAIEVVGLGQRRRIDEDDGVDAPARPCRRPRCA